MEKESFTWVDVEGEDGQGERNNLKKLKEQLDTLKNLHEVNRLRQEKSTNQADTYIPLVQKVAALEEDVSNLSHSLIQITADLEGAFNTPRQESTKQADPSLIQRLESLEGTVENFQKERSTGEARPNREYILNAWCRAPVPSPIEHNDGWCNYEGDRSSQAQSAGKHNTIYEGDIRADIRTIIAKEGTDPETADRWKTAFLDRYGLQWGVDCCKGNELGDLPIGMIRLFNIRAHVLHGWGGSDTRTKILSICDEWIETWRFTSICIPTRQYSQLCRMYYG
ncbi:hypothetical protein N7491_004959 [Penicillium cf. griseofulvum]|uniref:Uncharacterized protein n=1 Tax=Penicillium cf. griseofulvum TaxID=2972120 RepID=A0A9W9J0Y6_9EURO|nr:hypothetical protein N7472_007653 [Penicillium cf. griseofulvum]KAJ5434364.1 hypothetical protein N7491_004959 [Penicillium cf. griseofulvum]KAJ5452195.1 hypothetical protein N7445_000378 [Penicillium cf. griseofulvum]